MLFAVRLFLLSYSKMNPLKRFNTNIKVMNNDKNAKSFYVQAMVQNYLEHTYNTESIKFYPELINDIDLFRSDISKLIIKY